jgi:hypothetical protein
MSVVFPNPAGAESRVNLWFQLSFSFSSRRGRDIWFGGGVGIKNLVARTGDVTIKVILYNFLLEAAYSKS